MRVLLHEDEDLPGRPNSPFESVLTMFFLGTIAAFLLLWMPLPLRAWLDGGGSIDTVFTEWTLTLNAPAEALANAVSAFAVLLLTLFIEEGLKTSDKVSTGTRRNIATFVFFGGIVTVAVTLILVVGAVCGADAGPTVQAVGSASVGLFFASHVATRSVVSLTQQKESKQSSIDYATHALDVLEQLPVMAPRPTRWALVVAGIAVWALLPTSAFGLAQLVDPVNGGVWTGALVGGALLASLLFFTSWGAMPGNGKVMETVAWVAWWLLVIATTLAVPLAWMLNHSGNPTLPVLFCVSAAVGLLSAPYTWMPQWSLTLAVRQLQRRVLVASRDTSKMALANLQAWEERSSTEKGRGEAC